MSLDLGLVKSVLSDPSTESFEEVLESGVEQHLIGDGREAFIAINKHFCDFGLLPTPDILKNELGGMIMQSIAEAPEHPAKYYIKAIQRRALTTHVTTDIKKMIELVKEDPYKALETMKSSIHTAGKVNLEKGRGVNLTKDIEPRLREYNKIAEIADGIDGWRTQWPTVDKVTQGFHPGDISLFVGRLGIGKTFSLLTTLVPAIKAGASCLIISMEMSPLSIGRRLDAIFGRFPYEQFRKSKLDTLSFERYVHMLKEEYSKLGDLWCYGVPRVKTVQDIEILVERHKPDLLFIDGVYLLGGGGVTDRYLKVVHAAEELKYMSEEKRVSTIGTVQFTKESTKGKRMQKMDSDVEDIGYAYALAQIATNLFGIFQNEDLRINKWLLINFLKVREGEKAKGIIVDWDFDKMAFGQLGLWNGNGVDKTDENGNVIQEEDTVEQDTTVAF